MKKYSLLFLIASLLLINSSCDGQVYRIDNDEIVTGDIFNVPEWEWVTYETEGIEQPWRYTTTYSKIGDSCGIEFGGKVKVLGEMDSIFLLVEYLTDSNGIGTPCENGVIFVIDKITLSTFNAEHNKKVIAEKAKRGMINSILEKLKR